MTKKHFIRLAEYIKQHNNFQEPCYRFTQYQLACLANFCQEQNPCFDRQRWMDYIAGKCGPNGGTAK